MEQALFRLIDREPQISYLARPAVTLPSQRHLRQSRSDLNQLPELFDGPIAMVASLDLDFPEIEAFPATFSWRMASCACPRLKQITSGALTVAVWLENEQGQLLWQQRSGGVEDGHLWSISASGLVAPGLSPRQAVDETISREIGAEVIDLRPLAIVLFNGYSGTQVLYRGVVPGSSTLSPDPEQVSDLLWADVNEPPVDLRDSSKALLNVWAHSD
jgi:isopentenyldiphosphate isomerase